MTKGKFSEESGSVPTVTFANVKQQQQPRNQNLQQHQKCNDGVLITRNLILRLMCAVYLCAFLSFYYQSPGLYGRNGVLPAYIQFESVSKGKLSAIHQNPTLLHFASYVGLNVDYMMDLLALLGVIISFTGFISESFCLLPTFAALWSLYYSVVQVMQSFRNQADLLLLEAGFLCLILAPLNSTKKSSVTDKLGLTMFKWLSFRFLFASGIVKFFSGCQNWWNFSALSYHFETLPLPTGLSWYCHHLPARFLKTVTIFSNISEIVCPWFFFFPSRAVRVILFYWQLYLQICIICTGNFGFLNYLVCILLLALLDDVYIRKRSIFRFIMEAIIAAAFFTTILFAITLVFSNEIDKLKFKLEYLSILRSMTKLSPLVALVAIIAVFLTNLISHPSISQGKSFIKKISDINTLLAFTLVSLGLIGLSVVPHSNIDPVVNITNTELGKYYQGISKFNFINEYGLHLRKMRTERLEITLEYTDYVDGPWIEIPFLYKPWNVNETSSFIGLYLPRIDMNMYYASPANYRNHLWLLSLAYRILQNELNVLKLFGINKHLNSPKPKYVRGISNKFKFTPLAEIHNDRIWQRRVLGEHFPAFSIDNPTLISHLKTLKIVGTMKKSNISNQILKNILDFIREQFEKVEAHVLIFSILIAGFVIILLKK